MTLDGFDISAGNSSVIDVTVRVLNTSDQDAGNTFTNTAEYTYELTDGGADDLVPTGAAPTTAPATIVEPSVSLAKLVRNVTDAGTFAATTPADVGDTVEYQLTFTAAGGSGTDNFSDAFDVEVVDVLPDGFSYTGSTSVVTGAGNSVTDPSISGQTLTWSDSGLNGTANDIDIAEGYSITLIYRPVVGSSVSNGDTLTNTCVGTSDNGGFSGEIEHLVLILF